MNLYLISQNQNIGYDTYDSAVVVAKSEEDARLIHPRNTDWNGTDDSYGAWCVKERVKVQLIGKAVKGISGVICASFNAG
jgi:hypothetical protein